VVRLPAGVEPQHPRIPQNPQKMISSENIKVPVMINYAGHSRKNPLEFQKLLLIIDLKFIFQSKSVK